MKTTSTRVSAHFRHMGVAYLILIAALIFSYMAFNRVRHNVQDADQTRFDEAVNRMQTMVERRLARCIDQMYSVRALFAASKS
ncbi:MAG TPA: hypothetical protein VN516_09065, partial [Candidatus Baltobacteraceae bacterium]|nr:hypothetical protein [Candidatus Baltobacteraceae bacterium]